jgi:hypothetical protein
MSNLFDSSSVKLLIPQGLYRTAWNQTDRIELYDCPALVGRSILRAVLNDLSTGTRPVTGIKLVAGQTKKKYLQSYLQETKGPQVTTGPSPSHFYLNKTDIEEWLARSEVHWT